MFKHLYNDPHQNQNIEQNDCQEMADFEASYSLVIYPPEWRHFQQNGVNIEIGAILLKDFTY